MGLLAEIKSLEQRRDKEPELYGDSTGSTNAGEPLWLPHPENIPQQRACASEADIIGYGGSAGGGKSDTIIGLAITEHHRSLILRREAVDVRALMNRSREIIQDHGRLNEVTGVWKGLPDGRQIHFGGVKNAKDVHGYKGQSKDFLGIDEADQFTEAMVRFLMGWVRTTRLGQRCRVVLSFNPPSTAEGRWVLSFFGPWVDKTHPKYPTPDGELRWYYTEADGKEAEAPNGDPIEVVYGNGKKETIFPQSRTFIQARVTDNPYLIRTGYVAKLQAMPEPLRSQLLYGDMSAGMEDDAYQVIPTEWVRLAMARWTPEPPTGIPQTALGVDVARGGKAQTVISERRGQWFAALRKYPGADTPNGPIVAAWVIKAHQDDSTINIDILGPGGSPYDFLKGQTWLKTVIPVNNSGLTKLRDKSGKMGFSNVRAASYWKLREALDPDGEVKLALPPDNALLADLTAPRWKPLTSGIQLEPKKDIEERLGRSVDCGDAVVLAFWEGNRKILPLRIFPLGRATKGPRVVFCSLDDLRGLQVDQHALLTILRTPPLECSPDWVEPTPPHALTKLAGTIDLAFADLDPAQHQATWTENVPPWELPAEKLMLTREIGKKLWAWLTRRRDPVPEVYVFGAEVDAVGQSVAMAVADMLNLPREALWSPSRPEWKATREDKAPNQYVYEMTRKCRGLVV